MAKVVPLSADESARTGYTHVVNLKVSNGDLDVAAEIANIMPIPIGTTVQRAAIDLKTAWTTITSPTLSMGIANSGATGTNILNAQQLSSVTFVAVNLTTAVTASAQYLTVTQGGTSANAGAGEANVYLALVDLTAARNSFV